MGKWNDYICVDVETTGLNSATDRIIEIGAVYVRNGLVEDTFEALVRPCMKLSERVEELTGITNEMLKEERDIHEVIKEYDLFERKCAGASAEPGAAEKQTEVEFLPLLGHSVHFDYAFMKRAFVNAGMKYEREGIDTLKIARICLSGLPSRSLKSLTEHYGIDHQAHRALHDARATSLLYERLWEEFQGREDACKLFSPVRMKYHVKRQSPIRPHQKERLRQLMERYPVVLNVEIDSLMRNEADRMIDSILARYGK